MLVTFWPKVSVTKTQLKYSFMGNKVSHSNVERPLIPLNLFEQIFLYLPALTVIRFSRVSKYFYSLANDDSIWRRTVVSMKWRKSSEDVSMIVFGVFLTIQGNLERLLQKKFFNKIYKRDNGSTTTQFLIFHFLFQIHHEKGDQMF